MLPIKVSSIFGFSPFSVTTIIELIATFEKPDHLDSGYSSSKLCYLCFNFELCFVNTVAMCFI